MQPQRAQRTRRKNDGFRLKDIWFFAFSRAESFYLRKNSRSGKGCFPLQTCFSEDLSSIFEEANQISYIVSVMLSVLGGKTRSLKVL